MGSCCGGDAPQPPNPFLTASAQTGTNVSTALANAFLNNTNQITPTGSLTYDQTGSFTFTDPTLGVSYQIPRFTATTSLTPAQREIQSANEGAQKNLATLAEDQSGKLNTLLGTPIDTKTGIPTAGDRSQLTSLPQFATTFGASQPVKFGLGDQGSQQTTFGATNPLATAFNTGGQQQTAFGDAGAISGDIGNFGSQQSTFGNTAALQDQLGGFGDVQDQFGQAGDITRTYGPADDFSSDRGRVEQALYGRLNPQLDRERANLEQRLADQGIRYGSPAYNKAMDDYNRQANDARLAVTQTAGAEQQRMMDMAAQRAGFQNAAQKQAYDEALGRGTFANQAQQQKYQQALGSGQFTNAARQAAFEQAQARGTFANQAQIAQFGQMLNSAQFKNQAQQQLFAQLQARGAFANDAQARQFQENMQAGQFSNDALQKMYEQALGRGTFANQAQAQQFQEALQGGEFANQAQQQDFTQAAARGTFANNSLAQEMARRQAIISAQDTARNQALTEKYQERQEPINEISALLSGSQVSRPQFVTTPTNTIPTTDIAGLINTNFNQQQSNYNTQQKFLGDIIGGALGFGGNIAKSDVRSKENIHRMGTVFAADDDGEASKLPIYEFSYKDDPASVRHVGPMAQDVEKIDPGAVRSIRGVKHIDRSRVMGGILRAA